MVSLMVANGINFVVAFAYLVFIFPGQRDEFDGTTLSEVYGDDAFTKTMYSGRMIVVNVLPIIMTTTSILMANVILMESKWWLILETGAIYLCVNYIVALQQGVTSVYYVDWSIESGISPYSPVFGTLTLSMAAVGWHFFVCIMTQAV